MITARLKYLRIAPRKVRLVADLIKGLSFSEAERQLKFSVKRAAQPLLKLLNSAAANAKHNAGLDKESLSVKQVIVDAGPSLKRWLPRAMGRATPLLKRSSHVTLILETKPGKPAEGKADTLQVKEVAEEVKEKPTIQKEETVEKIVEEKKPSEKAIAPQKPHSSTSQSKKKFFSRQTFGNVKKIFRRKSI